MNCILERLICGNEKAVLGLTFPKMVITGTVKLCYFYDEIRE